MTSTMKRSSIYHSSKVVRKLTDSKAHEDRKAIRLPLKSHTCLSCTSNFVFHSGPSEVLLDFGHNRSPLICLDTNSSRNIVGTPYMASNSTEYLDMSFHLPLDSTSSKPLYLDSTLTETQLSEDNLLDISLDLKKDKGNLFLESKIMNGRTFSLELSQSNYETEGHKLSISSRDQFIPLGKMINSVTKCNSQFDPLLTGGDDSYIDRNLEIHKALLPEFTKVDSTMHNGDHVTTKLAYSFPPIYLHGSLTLENKHGISSLKFSLADPEIVLSVKKCSMDNGFNWIYTFHSIKTNEKGNHKRKQSNVAGQMQVSCYLCSQTSKNALLNNFIVSDYVLYDLRQTKRNFSLQQSSYSSLKEVEYGNLGSFPCLNSHLQVAAIEIKIPFEKKDQSKERLNQKFVLQKHLDVHDNVFSYSSHVDINVITSAGTHGLATDKEYGPSPLLQRWRLGGGCDCGGWDMTCPVVVYDNPRFDLMHGNSTEAQRRWDLFVQGSKDKSAAFTMKSIDGTNYLVDFHPHLSALQAFSISVSILHCIEISSAITLVYEKNKSNLKCNSLKNFFV